MKKNEKHKGREMTDEALEMAISDLMNGVTPEMREAEDVRHAIDEIFKASESLREALDTLDLSGYEADEMTLGRLEAMQIESERIAQRLQAIERRKKESQGKGE